MFCFEFLKIALIEAVQRLQVSFQAKTIGFRSGNALDGFGVTEALEPIEDLGFLVFGKVGKR